MNGIDTERRAGLKATMRSAANRSRDVADEMSAKFGGCDDPMHPWGPQVFRDYVDFIDRVARPLVEADGDHEKTQSAMALYRKQNPYGICVSLVMLMNRAERAETALDRVRALHTSSLEARGVVRWERDLAKSVAYCEECGGTYPCPTVRAIDGGRS